MSDQDLGIMAIPIVGVVAVLGTWLVYAVYNALPWSTVSPQAQSVGSSAANAAVTAISIDPTMLLIAAASVVGAIVTVVAVILWKSGGSSYGSDGV